MFRRSNSFVVDVHGHALPSLAHLGSSAYSNSRRRLRFDSAFVCQVTRRRHLPVYSTRRSARRSASTGDSFERRHRGHARFELRSAVQLLVSRAPRLSTGYRCGLSCASPDASPLSTRRNRGKGMATGDNDRFLGYGTKFRARVDSAATSAEAAPSIIDGGSLYNKGGEYRAGTETTNYVVDWARRRRASFVASERPKSYPQSTESTSASLVMWSQWWSAILVFDYFTRRAALSIAQEPMHLLKCRPLDDVLLALPELDVAAAICSQLSPRRSTTSGHDRTSFRLSRDSRVEHTSHVAASVASRSARADCELRRALDGFHHIGLDDRIIDVSKPAVETPLQSSWPQQRAVAHSSSN